MHAQRIAPTDISNNSNASPASRNVGGRPVTPSSTSRYQCSHIPCPHNTKGRIHCFQAPFGN
jgi:hypothetical protein